MPKRKEPDLILKINENSSLSLEREDNTFYLLYVPDPERHEHHHIPFTPKEISTIIEWLDKVK